MPDTICALATAPGPASIAVVRVSGPGTLPALDRLFGGARPSRQPTHTLRLRWLLRHGRRVDQVMLAVFRAPRSYTGEDMAELSCHGGPAVVSEVLTALDEAGCRAARPGEFTRRAVLAGKLTISQAEAIRDIVAARTARSLSHAIKRYAGSDNEFTEVSAELAAIRAAVEHFLGTDELDAPDSPRVAARIKRVGRRLELLLASARANRRLASEPHVAIVGRPNVGKSSLFNRVVGQPRSIVASFAGTTRDRVEACGDIDGLAVRFHDTAGLGRAARGICASAGQAESTSAIETADLVLAVFDGSEPARAADRRVLALTEKRPLICVVNKSDRPDRLGSGIFNGHARISVSALTGSGIARLRRAAGRSLRTDPRTGLGSERHVAQLEQALGHVRAALAGGLEECALELAAAADALTDGTGSCSPAVLDRLFSGFCVGK